MWRKRIDVYYEPHCELMHEEFQMVIPVCRDRLREKITRIYRWYIQGWDFEKLKHTEDECDTCEEPVLKTIVERIFRRD